MGIMSHGLAVGLGYLLGRPEGRQRLAQVGQQATDLARRPEVAQLRERGKGLAVEQAKAVKEKVLIRAKTPGPADGDATATVADAGSAGGRHRWNLRDSARRSRFSRSRAAHFPPSPGITPPASLGGTTVVEDSEAAVLGMDAGAGREAASPGERS
ncbi:MAG: hypothetical protein QOK35_2509 [Pseudonocardiales bacterium]|nr:hypothetical protein [Pseudonocardiales bacterium]